MGVVSNFQIAAIEEISILITDTGFDPSAYESLESRGVRILVAAPSSVLT